jgi:hypothetical protein
MKAVEVDETLIFKQRRNAYRDVVGRFEERIII